MSWRFDSMCSCGSGFWLVRSDGWRYHSQGTRERADSLAEAWSR